MLDLIYLTCKNEQWVDQWEVFEQMSGSMEKRVQGAVSGLESRQEEIPWVLGLLSVTTPVKLSVRRFVPREPVRERLVRF